MTNESVFSQFFEPRMSKCPKVRLTDQQMKFVHDFVARLWQRKIQEYPQDAKNIIERNIIGRMCEYAVLGGYGKTEYFDDSIGYSTEYETPDFWLTPKHKRHLPHPYIPVDVKGSNAAHRNTPLVEKQLKMIEINGCRYNCPDLMCLGNSTTGEVWMLGIASPEILKTHCTTSLIKNANNSKKTAFFGGDKLIDVPKTWDELRTLCTSLLVKL